MTGEGTLLEHAQGKLNCRSIVIKFFVYLNVTQFPTPFYWPLVFRKFKKQLLLCWSPDLSFRAQKRTPSPDGTKGITISAAKYSSEDCATLVQYTIAIVEYTRLCGPLKSSLERLNELQREIEENERIQRERQEEVIIYF